MKARFLRFDIRRAGKLLLLVFGGLLLVNLVFYVVLTRPQIAEYTRLSSRDHPQQLALRQYERHVTNKEEFLAALDQAEGDIECLKTDVLGRREQRMIEVQAELESLAKMFNINLEQVHYENDDLLEEGLERFGMVVPLQGGYQNLRKFISAVEDSEKFLVIERVALATGPEGGVVLQLNITLATFFELPESRIRAARGRA